MRIAVDAMGGDHAPAEIVRGAAQSLELLGKDDSVLLVGRETDIRMHLPADALGASLKIHPASDVIGMDDSPVEALRQKRDSSISVMVRLAAEGAVDAIISAGNTGAFAAACQLKLRTLPGVQRPGIAVVIPSFSGPVVICDVGANVAPKAPHLVQYAKMASAYAAHMLQVLRPRVGLLSIGGEEMKGNLLVKQARALLHEDGRVNFIGNVEGRDLFAGACDVAVCDGFVGNVVLKLSEGLAEGLFKTIQHELSNHDADLARQFEPVVRRIWARHDYSEYGGAPLLGVDGVCIICHGSSDARAIRNAIRTCKDFAQRNLNRVIEADLTEEAAHA